MRGIDMPGENAVITAENGLKNGSKLSEKQTGYILLRKQGMSIADAAKATGYSLGYAYQLEKKLKSYDLTDEYWLSEATKALKNIIKGKTFGEIEKIKDSTIMEAIKIVFDRYQPVVKHNKNLNIEAEIDFVDLSKYKLPRESSPEPGPREP
jgi:transcriptional regulator with XRE-family HTH domain